MVYTLIEMLDVDVISVRTFLDEATATQAFEVAIGEQSVNEVIPEDWGGGNPATLRRFAGDDAYAIELHATETEN